MNSSIGSLEIREKNLDHLHQDSHRTPLNPSIARFNSGILNQRRFPLENNKTQTVVFITSTLVVIGAITIFVPEHLSEIEAYIADNGLWGILVCILLYGVLGLTFIPSEPITVLTGALFGPLIATVVAGIGNTLAAVIEYFLAARVTNMTNFVERKEKMPFGLGKLPVNSPSFLIFARMIPGVGPKTVSVLSGLYRVPIFRYTWTTAITTFLGAAIFAFGGFGLVHLLAK
jgi:uncharacterized membrane protein YdjX (TVP38/TMEM64 family)